MTGLAGRWHILSLNPMVVCDTGHNEAGIREVLKNLDTTPYARLHMVIGMVSDKDVSKVLSMLPKHATYYYCAPNILRGLPQQELAAHGNAIGLKGKSYSSVADALLAAREKAQPKDLIFIGGSTFVVAEIL
ncbi:MAG: hypothetical protein EOP51_34920 [Sphingobacteriales bacterium]|nr:MAG: hypothetical protein EOP51_34920 [Sphingobacteriales bacterium]